MLGILPTLHACALGSGSPPAPPPSADGRGGGGEGGKGEGAGWVWRGGQLGAGFPAASGLDGKVGFLPSVGCTAAPEGPGGGGTSSQSQKAQELRWEK